MIDTARQHLARAEARLVERERELIACALSDRPLPRSKVAGVARARGAREALARLLRDLERAS